MKVTGIIAEYNPFHNGHAYQIRKARELTGADYVIVVMSGNYVQRGAPAILDKFTRTAMALSGGADLVLELPAVFATSSAEMFAAAAIALLAHTGITDSVCFGCETPDSKMLSALAALLAEEPDAYTALLAEQLKDGRSFPAAREHAVCSYLLSPEGTLAFPHAAADLPAVRALLSSPNNILALEYEKARIRQHAALTLVPIRRIGSGYHDTNTDSRYSSATAIRSLLLRQTASAGTFNVPTADASAKNLSGRLSDTAAKYLPDLLSDPGLLIPKEALSCLKDAASLVDWNDFSPLLYYRLLSLNDTGYTQFADSSPALSNRIQKQLCRYVGFSEFCDILKTKEITYSHISRLLLHILLDMDQTQVETGLSYGYVPYIRPLGFRRQSSALCGAIRSHSDRPFLSRPSTDWMKLPEPAELFYRKEARASDLYYGVVAQKTHHVQKKEHQRELIFFS